LPFSATVNVNDLGKLKEFAITIKGVKDSLFRPSSPDGGLEIPNDGKPAITAVTKAEEDGTATYTFQLSPEQIERARFWFVEDVADSPQTSGLPLPLVGHSRRVYLRATSGQRSRCCARSAPNARASPA
jgi:hypothetical protein